MEKHPETVPMLRLVIAPKTISLFSTVLQAGIEIKTATGEAIGVFLEKLPDFNTDYISDRIQTIFLNGIATDDLATPLTGDNPVLAISAAMPGLAGAIFRRNSLHAALRTTGTPNTTPGEIKETTVTLKLFNVIAHDRGGRLLQDGVTIKAVHLQEFFTTRATLLDHIRDIRFSDQQLTREELAPCLAGQNLLNLILEESNDGT